jgi:hypothetical protein
LSGNDSVSNNANPKPLKTGVNIDVWETWEPLVLISYLNLILVLLYTLVSSLVWMS